MKYFEAVFTISPYSTDACDLLASLAGEAGFETFEETENGLLGYVQQTLFERNALDAMIEDFPFEDTTITYDIHPAEDRDWNIEWEQQGFEPILISDRLVIHDGHHLPDTNYPYSIEIDAHLAFGTGTHETTRMICATILELTETGKLSSPRVLDCGTGTGILSICALKLGAQEAIGYDIDEWSVDNSRHNAVINSVDGRFNSLLGDVSILNKLEGKFGLVLANINRNILLSGLPSFCKKMCYGAYLILSGFYTADSDMLINKAQDLGLLFQEKKEDQDWVCLVFKKL